MLVSLRYGSFVMLPQFHYVTLVSLCNMSFTMLRPTNRNCFSKRRQFADDSSNDDLSSNNNSNNNNNNNNNDDTNVSYSDCINSYDRF